MNKNLKWLAAIFSALLIGGVIAPQIVEYLIPSNGNITTIGVNVTWLDGSPVTILDWGTVPNSTARPMAPINITNIKNTQCTLSLSTNATSPSIISLTLTWNYTGTILQPQQWVIVELTQTITATGPWNYNTIITAIEVI